MQAPLPNPLALFLKRPTVRFSANLLCSLLLATCLVLTGCHAKPDANPASMSVDEHLKLAQQLIHQGDYQQAYFHLNQAMTLTPNDPEIHRNMGWLYLYIDEPEKATQELAKLNALAPDTPQANYLAGAIYDYLDQPQDAVQFYQKALVKMPQNPKLYYDLGTSLNNLNKPREAIRYFRAGLVLLPSASPKGQRAQQAKSSDTNTAASTDTVVDTTLDQRTNFLFSLCNSHYALKDFAAALKECQEAVQTTPNPEEKGRITDFMENMKLMRSLEDNRPEGTGDGIAD